ncbi:MAG: hypothetical protein ACLVIY_05770 [Anaerobutyricum soehngenii]
MISLRYRNRITQCRIFLIKTGYELFDKIAVHLNRKEQWIKILEDFVGQLQAHASLFDRKQMETACYVEDMLYMYTGRDDKNGTAGRTWTTEVIK